MSNAKTRFEEAVSEFRVWAAAHPVSKRYGEWEFYYDQWPAIWATFKNFLQSSDSKDLDQHTRELVLYALARDNETETLKDALIDQVEHLLALARTGLHSAEQDARWQLADALGSVQAPEDEIVSILEAYTADSDEYVSRRALLALGRRLSPVAEVLAQRAWNTGHEYQRIAALHVLSALGSPLLPSYLEDAGRDGRRYLAGTADQLRLSLQAPPDTPGQVG